MTSPKHLWSGDWEAQSAAAAAARRRVRPPEPEPEPEPELEQSAAARRRLTLPAIPRPSRAVVLFTVALLVLVGGAYALASLNHNRVTNVQQQPAWLGAQLTGWPGGVLVAGVAAGSPAQAAGLHAGDLITAVEYRPVVAPVNVTAAVSALAPGQPLVIQYVRDHATHTTVAKLAPRPRSASYP
jgi:membrane-associated protease RseP (regulator of RpoE activity)